jgi:hypothetical protein
MNQLFICLLSINPVKMRVPEKRSDDEALLSLDFMIGFSIFMVGLIFVAVMVSGLLVQLQSRTIDYDAVAYRTSVVLVEDPGEPPDWDLLNFTYYSERENAKRLGLGIEKGYPGILKLEKVKKFFNSSKSSGCSATDELCIPEDYRDKVIFGDYPYNFNISLKDLGTKGLPNYTVGEDVPPNSNYGFIKRIVKIQIPGSEFYINGTPEGNESSIIVRIDFPELYYRISPYRIDPLKDDLKIFINLTGWSGLNLTDFQVCKYPLIGLPGCIGGTTYDNSPRVNITIDGDPNKSLHDDINSNLTITLEGGLFPRIGYDEFSSIDVNLLFSQNVTNETLYNYTYSANLSQPELEPAVMEVRVW